MNVLTIGALAIAGVAAQADIYTATKSADVIAAQATAKTAQPTSHVPGKVRCIKPLHQDLQMTDNLQ